MDEMMLPNETAVRTSLVEFGKLRGARTLFGCFITLAVTTIVTLLGKNRYSLIVQTCPEAFL